MRLEIDIAEHHYNNIMALDSVSLGRVPYKGIIMYSINAIKHGKVLAQEPTKNNLGVEKTDMIDKSNFSQEQYKADLQSAYDCGYEQAKNDFAVDLISRADALDCVNWGYSFSDIYKKINELPSVTPQEPKTGHWISTYGNVKCSVCGSVKDSREVGRATHYCDFCGAKMESEEV